MKYLRKHNQLLKERRDQWGPRWIYFIDFEAMTWRHSKGVIPLYLNGDEVLCTNEDKVLPEWIQAHCHEYLNELIELTLLGEDNATHY